MDPRYSAQDVVRCTLCKMAVAPMYCEVCHVDLCKDCVVKHLSDQSKIHRVVSLKQFLSTPKCPDHPSKQCELYCEQCKTPICSICIIAKRHKHHDVTGIMERNDREHLLKQFGSLSLSSFETEEQGYTLPSPGAESSPLGRPLLDVPRLITELATGYKLLYHVCCLSDEEIWTCGEDRIIKLYNLQGELVKSVETMFGNLPQGIAVTRSGDLMYSNYMTKSLNLVSNSPRQPLITPHTVGWIPNAEVHKLISQLRGLPNAQGQKLIAQLGWIPRDVCSTSSDDLLVIMDSDYVGNTDTKVVRYSGTQEKQTIQWDDQGRPLYSSGGLLNHKYLTENRNLDICLADFYARAVVVVSSAGKLRFRYTGPPSVFKRSFGPLGITTDSQGRILTSDRDNHCIHMVDQDGHFLRYIDNCGLHKPWGLCVDSRDNVFVAESTKCRIKKIQYYK